MSHEVRPFSRRAATPAIAEASIRVERTGFAVCVKKGPPVRIPWDDVLEIRAFKVDLIARDLVCLEISVGQNGVRTRAIQLHEEMPGWYVFIESLPQQLPGCEPHWWAEVTFPAFATNERTIYKRDGQATDERLCVNYP